MGVLLVQSQLENNASAPFKMRSPSMTRILVQRAGAGSQKAGASTTAESSLPPFGNGAVYQRGHDTAGTISRSGECPGQFLRLAFKEWVWLMSPSVTG